MRPNIKVQELYRIHTEHIPSDTKHLGEAESIQDILSIVEKIQPNVYMLAKCCTDGKPTLQLATWKMTRRVRLNLLSITERSAIIQTLENKGIQYRRTSYLPLNPDFTETTKCMIQQQLKPLYNFVFKISQLLR